MSAARQRNWLIASMCFLGGCITDHAIDLELRPPRDADGGAQLPSDVIAHELRLYRVDDGEGCPDLTTAATAAPFARLAHVQSFSGSMGEPIGELPPGRWAFSVLSREIGCGVRLYGCTEAEIVSTAPPVIVVELLPASTDLGCGACRTCADGRCSPSDAICP